MIWEEMIYNKFPESIFEKMETEPEWFFEYNINQKEEEIDGTDETDFCIFD